MGNNKNNNRENIQTAYAVFQFSSVRFSFPAPSTPPPSRVCFAPLSRTGIENGNNHRPNRRRLRHQKFARIEKPNWTQGVRRGGCSIWTGKIGPFHYVYEYVCVCVSDAPHGPPVLARNELETLHLVNFQPPSMRSKLQAVKKQQRLENDRLTDML